MSGTKVSGKLMHRLCQQSERFLIYHTGYNHMLHIHKKNALRNHPEGADCKPEL